MKREVSKYLRKIVRFGDVHSFSLAIDGWKGKSYHKYVYPVLYCMKRSKRIKIAIPLAHSKGSSFTGKTIAQIVTTSASEIIDEKDMANFSRSLTAVVSDRGANMLASVKKSLKARSFRCINHAIHNGVKKFNECSPTSRTVRLTVSALESIEEETEGDERNYESDGSANSFLSYNSAISAASYASSVSRCDSDNEESKILSKDINMKKKKRKRKKFTQIISKN